MIIKKLAVITCLSAIAFNTTSFLQEESLIASAKVEAKDVSAYTLENVILEKDNQKIKVSFFDYIIVAGNAAALNGYQITYLVSGDNKAYDLFDYVGYYSEGDIPETVLKNLINAGKDVNISDVENGQIIDGKLTVADEDQGDFDLISIE